MWNFWYFRTNVRENEISNVNKQLIDNFFIEFDLILNVVTEKCEYFIDTNSNIDVNIAKKIDETNEMNEINFFLILYVNFDVKNRKFDLIYCSRMWLWNKFLKLKFCSQCLQITFEQLICLICFKNRIIDEK